MKYLLSIFLILAGIWLFDGCKSDGDKLPEPTMEGLNTFGCKVNGKVWIANGGGSKLGSSAKPIEVEFKLLNANEFSLFIHANSKTDDRVQISIPKGRIGTNTLTDRYDEPFGIYYDNKFRIFNSIEANPGKATITRLDTINKIVSGTFAFDAQYIVNKEIVHITEGRFDVHFNNR